MALHEFIAVRTLRGQLAGARAAGDRVAAERLSDDLARAELALSTDERDQLHLEALRNGVAPAPFPRTKTKDKTSGLSGSIDGKDEE